jgi:DNA-binding transcriptional MerR regulator
MSLPEYRLDELSALSGVSVRNIRAYRERGLLDPPRREGRSAFYDQRHLSQLATINELLRKGFTSAHIAEFLDSTRQGHDLSEILGLQQAVFGPASAEAVVDVDPDGEEARRLLEHGFAEAVDGRVTLVDPTIAEIVSRAPDQRPYVQAMLGVADRVTDLLDEVAKRVVEGVDDGVFSDDYRAIGRRVVIDQFEAALQRRLPVAGSDRTADVALEGCGPTRDN